MGDVLFRNGTVFDGATFLPSGTDVRVSGSTIVEVGAGLDSSGAEPVDLAGGTVLPGFIDAHAHPVFAGNQLRHCDLRDAEDVDGYLAIVAKYASSHPDETWITGGGWSMDAFPGGIATRQALDAIVQDRPVYLPNRDGHGAWVNSRALELAGITKDTPDPADGRIEREEDGSPSGMLQEGAAHIVRRLLPSLTDEDWYQALLLAQEHMLALGVTGWQDAIIGDYMEGTDPLPAYLRAAGEGTLRVDVVGALWWDRHKGIEQLPHLLHRHEIGQAPRFRADVVKFMLDGVAENHTAAMLEPYLDADGCESDHSGLDFVDPAELPGFVTALDAQGFGIHFHALGDRAVRNALDALDAARRSNGPARRRHSLAHLQVVHPDDIGRFGPLGATANIQALWACHEPQMDELTIPFLGARRAGWQYPFGSLRNAAAHLCAGSDWPVSSADPIAAVHVAVNRSTLPAPGRHAAEAFLPEQAIPIETALAAYTSGSASVNGRASSAGWVKAGWDADLAVVDADLAHVEPADIGRAVVTQTWVQGELAYSRSSA